MASAKAKILKKGTRKVPMFFIKSEFEAQEFMKCKANLWYFINNYVKIVHPVLGKIPFILYPFQWAILKAFVTNQYTITLKPRQMGMSTLVCAYVLWLCLFHEHKICVLVSIKKLVARALLRKIRRMYTDLPEYLKVEVVNGDRGGDGTADQMLFANGSEVQALAATEDAARSEALSCLVMDEVAFQEYAESIWGAAQQTLATGGQAILLSTAYGMGNFFHKQWVKALEGTNGMTPLELNWRMHPDRDEKWYWKQRMLLGAKRCAQEIDCDFLTSGYNVFDMSKIRAIEEKVFDTPIMYEDYGGWLKQYFAPVKGVNYVLGADVASGRARDFSTFSIMDMKGKEYCCFKGQMGVRQFTDVMMKWGYKYNTALIAPEANSIGEGVIVGLQDHGYPMVYHSVKRALKLDEFEHDKSLIAGWLTTNKSRHEIITELDDDLRDEMVDLCNPFLVQEANTFIYNESNKPIAMGKELNKRGGSSQMMLEDDEESAISYTDDAIFSVCIANYVRKMPDVMRGNLPLQGGWGEHRPSNRK